MSVKEEFDIKVVGFNVEELKTLKPKSTDDNTPAKAFKFEHCEKIKETDFLIDVHGFHSIKGRIQ